MDVAEHITSLQPQIIGEIRLPDSERYDEIDRKHKLLAEYLQLKQLDGLLLERPENFSWVTCGGDNTRRWNGETTAALFISRDARVVLCNAVDSGQIFDREVPGMGFQVKERPWTESREVLFTDLCRGRNVASDTGVLGTVNVSHELADFRRTLSDHEAKQLRAIGRGLVHAVEATARNLKRGTSESEVAGEIAHRLIKHELTPIRIQVQADGQGARYRHWSYGTEPIERHCVISAIARRGGLHAACTRTVSFGKPPADMADTHQVASLLQATGVYFSQAGWEVAETWKRLERIYEKFGVRMNGGWLSRPNRLATTCPAGRSPRTPQPSFIQGKCCTGTQRPLRSCGRHSADPSRPHRIADSLRGLADAQGADQGSHNRTARHFESRVAGIDRLVPRVRHP